MYHVTARGVEKRDIFLDDDDRRAFIRSLHHFASETNTEILAYCLMTNHFHIAVKVDKTPLTALMHRLLTGYASTFNAKYERKGHLFEGRHVARVCVKESHFARVIPYVHMNPVAAGMVDRPEEWQWSSYRPGIDSASDGSDPWEDDPMPTEPALLRKALAESSEPLGDIAASVCPEIPIALLRSGSRRRAIAAARRQFAEAAMKEGHPINAIASWLSVGPSAVSRGVQANTANKCGPGTTTLSSAARGKESSRT